MSEEPFVRALIKHRIGAIVIEHDNPEELRFYTTNGKRRLEVVVRAEGGRDAEFVEYWAEQVAKTYRKAECRELEV